MIKRGKSAQGVFGISFGVLFSIIIIIAIAVVSIYAINHFLSLGKCTDVGFFYDELQDEIDKAWNSGIYKGTFKGNGKLPSEIKNVCFGPLDSGSNGFSEIHTDLNLISHKENANIYLYPPEATCIKSEELKHIEPFEEFFCKEVIDGKVSIRLEKETTNPLVKLI